MNQLQCVEAVLFDTGVQYGLNLYQTTNTAFKIYNTYIKHTAVCGLENKWVNICDGFIIMSTVVFHERERERGVIPSCLTLCDPMDYSPPGSSVHGNSPGENTRVGCHVLLQGIFPTQGSNPGHLHCRQTLYPLSHQGKL